MQYEHACFALCALLNRSVSVLLTLAMAELATLTLVCFTSFLLVVTEVTGGAACIYLKILNPSPVRSWSPVTGG